MGTARTLIVNDTMCTSQFQVDTFTFEIIAMRMKDLYDVVSLCKPYIFRGHRSRVMWVRNRERGEENSTSHLMSIL